MRILLDTHLFYCWFYEPVRLSREALKTIMEADEVFVSPASMWEIAMKTRIGKINANPRELFDQIAANDFQELPVLSAHALLMADLPKHHSDPFDRILIAQAISEPLHLVTVDPQLKQYSELVIQV